MSTDSVALCKLFLFLGIISFWQNVYAFHRTIGKILVPSTDELQNMGAFLK